MSEVRIRAARAGEAGLLSDLALRSKAHWGYDEAFLEACRPELTYTQAQIRTGGLLVAVGPDDRPVGFYRIHGEPPDGELAALFVDPARIGTGVGGALLRHALAAADEAGYDSLGLDADPGAEGFYAHAGATTVGSTPSASIPGRRLPRMTFELGSHRSA
ncbi:GNAT family N-acetyltransferase [Occultella glacieicola]|uniref:GNAT family N-acetyltransferase n=1 Tax=Occultella glacieicola TaxID=2518684 RepID=A0ABY2EAW1_9MICO|nr:GNAT family N-acetyltransferase [Occultella glacieicola]TDE97364.1 GNAT family N-acetyltransferase [Occultella glacieicola]